MGGLVPMLNLSIGAYTAQQEETKYFGRLEHHIREGFWPFRPKRIDISTGFDIDINVYALFVGVYFSDKYVFPVTVYFEPGEMSTNPDEEIDRIGWVLTQAYRYRPRVSSNHHLGEE